MLLPFVALNIAIRGIPFNMNSGDGAGITKYSFDTQNFQGIWIQMKGP